MSKIEIESKDELIKFLREERDKLQNEITKYMHACANLNAENTYLKGACNELKAELERVSFNENMLGREYNKMQEERGMQKERERCC